LLDRLTRGEPLQYITGHQEFMGIDFYVNKNVLIPQPDTEILVQAVLKYLEHNCGKENVKIFENLDKTKLKKSKILDLCTGSGAIAISLVKNCQNGDAEVVASDISTDALEVASINCRKNRTKVKLVESNLFENIEGVFDIIVSNPPYIETDTIEELDIDVQNEPHLALDGGKDGLEFYRIIRKNIDKYLKKNGTLMMEIGYDQKDDLLELFEGAECIKDFAENDRVIVYKNV
jgi:release factor glutamine methyltransferase